MRVLLLTPEYDGVGGGIITSLQTLAPALRERGIEVHVLEGSGSRAEHDPSPRTRDGVSVETLGYSRLRSWHGKLSAFNAMPQLRLQLAAAWAMWEQSGFGERFNIIEATDYGLLFVPPTIDLVRPVVAVCHGSLGQLADHDPMLGRETEGILIRLIESSALRAAYKLQTYSSANARFWENETGRGVDVVLPPFKLPPLCGVRKTVQRGLVVGRVQRWKGPQ